MTISILLADDHTILRDGLRALLECNPNFIVVGSVANGREAVAKARELKPNVVLMDIAMPELNGIDATEQIHRECIATQVIILSIHDTTEHIYRAFRAGALGYLLKESAGAEAVLAINAVHEGRRYLTQRIADIVLDSYLLQRDESTRHSPLERLSQREREVLQLLSDGKTADQIATHLNITTTTVEAHQRNIMRKLDVHSAAQLATYAILHGLVAS